jgi:DNA-binding MarR family transcriptional regulator
MCSHDVVKVRSDVSMPSLSEGIERYVGEVLHTDTRLRPYAKAGGLPTYLSAVYDFFEGDVGNRRIVFMARHDDEGTPAEMAKHVKQVQEKTQEPVALVLKSVNPHNRSRLIGASVPFVVPGNQLYLPHLAMDLREYYRKPIVPMGDKLTPAAQALLFFHLLGWEGRDLTLSQLANQLGYTPVSMGRAFDELERANLAMTAKNGRERHIRYERNRRDLFEEVRAIIRNPIRTRRYIKGDVNDLPIKLSGEAALSRLSILNPPSIPSYAMSYSEWSEHKPITDVEEVPEYAAEAIIEIWSYDPAALSREWTVDPLSLYAQFGNHNDERVLTAAEDILRTINW